MQKFRLAVLITFGLLLMQAAAHAVPIPIDFVPNAQTVELGNQVSADVFVTPGISDIISEFDMIVDWDDSLLSFAGIEFGTALGDPGFFEAFTDFADLGGGRLNVAELSLLFDFTGLQDGAPFTLFTLTFDTIGIGTSALGLTGNIAGQPSPFNYLGDFFGNPLEAIPGTGAVTVIDPVAVPEPATWLLFLAGMLAVVASRRERFDVGKQADRRAKCVLHIP